MLSLKSQKILYIGFIFSLLQLPIFSDASQIQLEPIINFTIEHDFKSKYSLPMAVQGGIRGIINEKQAIWLIHDKAYPASIHQWKQADNFFPSTINWEYAVDNTGGEILKNITLMRTGRIGGGIRHLIPSQSTKLMGGLYGYWDRFHFYSSMQGLEPYVIVTNSEIKNGKKASREAKEKFHTVRQTDNLKQFYSGSYDKITGGVEIIYAALQVNIMGHITCNLPAIMRYPEDSNPISINKHKHYLFSLIAHDYYGLALKMSYHYNSHITPFMGFYYLNHSCIPDTLGVASGLEVQLNPITTFKTKLTIDTNNGFFCIAGLQFNLFDKPKRSSFSHYLRQAPPDRYLAPVIHAATNTTSRLKAKYNTLHQSGQLKEPFSRPQTLEDIDKIQSQMEPFCNSKESRQVKFAIERLEDELYIQTMQNYSANHDNDNHIQPSAPSTTTQSRNRHTKKTLPKKTNKNDKHTGSLFKRIKNRIIQRK